MNKFAALVAMTPEEAARHIAVVAGASRDLTKAGLDLSKLWGDVSGAAQQAGSKFMSGDPAYLAGGLALGSGGLGLARELVKPKEERRYENALIGAGLGGALGLAPYAASHLLPERQPDAPPVTTLAEMTGSAKKAPDGKGGTETVPSGVVHNAWRALTGGKPTSLDRGLPLPGTADGVATSAAAQLVRRGYGQAMNNLPSSVVGPHPAELRVGWRGLMERYPGGQGYTSTGGRDPLGDLLKSPGGREAMNEYAKANYPPGMEGKYQASAMRQGLAPVGSAVRQPTKINWAAMGGKGPKYIVPPAVTAEQANAVRNFVPLDRKALGPRVGPPGRVFNAVSTIPAILGVGSDIYNILQNSRPR